MDKNGSTLLEIANAALLARRVSSGVLTTAVPPCTSAATSPPADSCKSWAIINAQKELSAAHAQNGYKTAGQPSIDEPITDKEAREILARYLDSKPAKPAPIPAPIQPKETDKPPFATVHPEFMGWINRQGMSNDARAWLALKYVSAAVDGSSGLLWIDVAKQQLQRILRVNRRTANRLLKRLDGRFVAVNRKRNRVNLFSFAVVALNLGYDGRFTANSARIPFTDLLAIGGDTSERMGHKARQRAYNSQLLRCFYASRPDQSAENPISQDAIKNTTGFSADSQQRYNPILGVEVKSTIEIYGRLDKHPLASKLGTDGFYQHVDYKNINGRGKNAVLLAKRLPNTYGLPEEQRAERASRNVSRRIRKKLTILKSKNHPLKLTLEGSDNQILRRGKTRYKRNANDVTFAFGECLQNTYIEQHRKSDHYQLFNRIGAEDIFEGMTKEEIDTARDDYYLEANFAKADRAGNRYR